ncbi:flagellar filament capping protein FliD [Candidatus Njordibacter sp. Uisw_056]|uniref:flagellar filament capping protein FliD n=1 Tax=Candidatus Njordibacter sp. Uisw_056 TaxID=3230973 RepID=UPI003D5BFFE3
METDYLQALGAGGGFDTKQIVTALVAAEKAGKQSSIDRRTADVDTKLSGIGQLKSALQTLQTSFARVDDKADFNFSSLTNSAPAMVSANFDATSALPGTYTLTVSQLAKNDVIISSEYSDISSNQATASVTIQVGSGSVETVTLAAGATTLNDLVDGINALTANVSARIVETSVGAFRVVVEGPQGTSNALTINDTVFGLVTPSNKIQTAQNATVTVNGLLVSSASNQISGVVPGLKLNLMSETTTDVVLSVSRDTSAAKASINDLVASYNVFEGIIRGLTASGTPTMEGGALKSDASVTAIREKVRGFLTSDSSTPGATKMGMSDIGVSLQRNGTFKVNDTALSAALTSDYTDITKMFSADTNNQSSYDGASRGIAGDIVHQITSYLAFDGLIKTREGSYSNETKYLSVEQSDLDKKMAAIQTRYTQQFSTMSRIMDEMKATQDYLESSLGNLPFTSKND